MINRRQVLKFSLLGSVVSLGTGFWALPTGQRPGDLSIEGAQGFLRALEGQALVSLKGWSPTEVFNHCAQSIEYSMTGYPELKPAWFRSSVGPLAFSVFSARGAMRHPLAEIIPGAPALDEPATQATSLARLQKAFTEFAAYADQLKPHFAYGTLDHADYAAAHVLHFYNHMSLVRPA